MDVAAADAFARRKLAHVPRLNKKVKEARAIQQYHRQNRVDEELAAAQARLAKLKAAADEAKQSSLKQANADTKPTSKQTAVQPTNPADHTLKSSPPAIPRPAVVSQHSTSAAVPAAASVACTTPAPAGQAVSPTKFVIFPSRASMPGGHAAASGSNTKDSPLQSGSTSSRSNHSSSGSSAGTHRSRRMSGRTAKEQQQQQQIAMADDILSSINAYMTAELANIEAAAQREVLLHHTQTSASVPLASTGPASSKPQTSNSNINSSSIQSTTAGAAAADTAAPAEVDLAAAKAAALQALGVDTAGYTPDLLASLALRFQDYNLPQGLNSMPDLGTIALATLQEQQEHLQKQLQQQESWQKHQQEQQLARQQAADRHLQLYQLGVRQQRQRLGHGGTGALLTHYRMRRQQQRCASATGQVAQQQLQQQLQTEQLEQRDSIAPLSATRQCLADAGELARRVCSSSAGDGCMTPDSTAAAGPTCPTGSESSDCSSAQRAGQPCSQRSEHPAATAAVPVVGAEPDRQRQVPANTSGSCNANRRSSNSSLHHAPAGVSSSTAAGSAAPAVSPFPPAAVAAAKPVPASTMNSTDPLSCQDDTARFPAQRMKAGCTAQATHVGLHDSAASALTAVAAAQLSELGQTLGSCQPPRTRYKTDLPRAPAGARHGHLSPVNLNLEHLPGSRRQVYAQIQDALACSDVITAAEQNLRALTYAPCAGTVVKDTESNRSNS